MRLFIFFIFLIPKFWISRSPNLKISGFSGPQISKFPKSQISRFPDFQTPPAPAPLGPDELSEPNLTPLLTHPGIKYVARALAATFHAATAANKAGYIVINVGYCEAAELVQLICVLKADMKLVI